MSVRPLFWPFVFLLALAGGALVVYVTAGTGLGSSSDAANYVSAAESLLKGEGFVRYDGTPYTLWPPLYPMLLAGTAALTGTDAMAAARLWSAITHALLVICTALVGRRYLRSAWWGLFAGAVVVFSVPVLQCTTMAWSDSLFALLCLTALYSFSRFLTVPRATGLLIVAVLTSLACLQRYVGISLLLVFLPLLMLQRSVPLRRRIVWASGLLALSVVPLGIWMGRNWAISGTWTGPRLPVQFPFAVQLQSTVETVSLWLLPSVVPAFARIAIVTGIAVVLWWVHRSRHASTDKGGTSFAHLPYSAFTVFVWVYVLFLLWQAYHTHIDQLSSSRFFLPVYVPVILLVLRGAQSLAEHVQDRIPLWPISDRVVTVVALLWLLYPVSLTVHQIDRIKTEGIGFFHTRAWAQSETLHWLDTHDFPGRLLSNLPEAIYVLRGRPCLKTAALYDSELHIADMLNAGHNGYLVWFDLVPVWGVYSPSELTRWFSVDPIVQLRDGAVYKLSAPQPSTR